MDCLVASLTTADQRSMPLATFAPSQREMLRPAVHGITASTPSSARRLDRELVPVALREGLREDDGRTLAVDARHRIHHELERGRLRRDDLAVEYESGAVAHADALTGPELADRDRVPGVGAGNGHPVAGHRIREVLVEVPVRHTRPV